MTNPYDWTPHDLFKRGADGFACLVESGAIRTRWYRRGDVVDERVTPIPTERIDGYWAISSEQLDAERPHLNPADLLPPVTCPLLIEVDDRLLRAERTGIIPNKADGMEYRLDDGSLIYGRYRWTYP